MGGAADAGGATVEAALRRLVDRPTWLLDALDPARVREALQATGGVTIVDVAAPRLALKGDGGPWAGTYVAVVEEPGGRRREVRVRVELDAPDGAGGAGGAGGPASSEGGAPGDESWIATVPELGIRCATEPPEAELESLPALLDPASAREVVGGALANGPGGFGGASVVGARGVILNHKPGTRCTLRHDLDWSGDAGRDLPATVITKTYRKAKGLRAWDGMRALWATPLAAGDVVAIAEPLGWDADRKVLVQGPVPGDRTLEDVIRAASRDGGDVAIASLATLVEQVGRALAELHRCGAQAGVSVRLDDELEDEVDGLLARLATVLPEVAADLAPLASRVHEMALVAPADPEVPSHGSFDGDQVLLGGDGPTAVGLSFIDFDGFCDAEPALDVGHFRAALLDSALASLDERELADPARVADVLDPFDDVADAFLDGYRTAAHVTPARLVAWEAADYLRDALQLWTKPKHRYGLGAVVLLERTLRRAGA